MDKKALVQPGTIARIWHGWTSIENAEAFETILTTQAIPEIEKNRTAGYIGIQVLRRQLQDEVEFTTIMWFSSIVAVKEFAGDDYERAHVDPEVRPLLLRYDNRPKHTGVVHSTL